MPVVDTVQASCPRGTLPALATTPDGEVLIVGIISKEGNQPEWLALEAVLQSDLALLRDQTWWDGVRTGRLPAELSELEMQLIPGERYQNGVINGFTLRLNGPSHSHQRRFTVHALDHTASRAVARLLKQKQIAEDQTIDCVLLARPVTHPSGDRAAEAEPIRAVARSEPIHLERAPLGRYLQQSVPLEENWGGATDSGEQLGPMPVFFYRSAWRKGQQFARRGRDRESAGVWTGRLMRDTGSPEVFVVVDACIDAAYAQADQFSVKFSGATWARVRAVLAQRRQRLGRPHEMILGSVHGHNFLPGTSEKEGPLCPQCPSVAQCQKTSAVLSADDLAWHRSVFTGQPYAVLVLWGFTPREEEVWQCYSLANATLMSRPVRLLNAEA